MGEAVHADFSADPSKEFLSIINGPVLFDASGAQRRVVEALLPMKRVRIQAISILPYPPPQPTIEVPRHINLELMVLEDGSRYWIGSLGI